MTKYLVQVLFCLVLFSLSPLHAADTKELNSRQHVDNGSMNKISGAKLRGMLANNGAKFNSNSGITNKDGCTTQIGNLGNNQSISGRRPLRRCNHAKCAMRSVWQL